LRWLRRIPVARTLLNQCLYLAQLCKIRHADVVHVYSASYWSFLLAPVPAILASEWFGKPVILNYHSGEADDHLATWGFRVHPWLRRVHRIVVPSTYLQKVFAQHGYHVQVVRNIIDTSFFHYRERNQLRPRLLSNRNLEAHYGIGATLKAFALLRKQWPQARLTVAGYGSERARLEEWVRSERLDGVEFVGRVEPEAMPRLYDDADIFVNSSVIDNQPVSILEAFAAGLPVVSTPVGDIPAMLRNQQNGTLVPRNDPEAMAAAIARLLDAPGKAVSMARSAREEAEQYTWSQVRGAWTALYRNECEAATPV
jgi:glycosyltransferase involved in cell wall biosynthesis